MRADHPPHFSHAPLQLVSYQDAQPGMPLKGTVVSVDEPSGLLVEIAPHIRALVPVAHMSDLGNEAGRKKYKVGRGLEFMRMLALTGAAVPGRLQGPLTGAGPL